MAPKSNVPIRIGGSKTRSGCRTCKQRHVKCDEEQPTCFKCRKGNRYCVYDGSQPHTPKAKSIPDSKPESTVSVVPAGCYDYLKSANLNPDISPYGPRQLAEVTAVKYFAINLGKELAGSFSDDVWIGVLPRVAQHEPSIWHALVAVSTLDSIARFHNEIQDANPNISYAIKHYGRALQELNARIASVESGYCKDVVLLCCILFAVFECLRNHFEPALRHITGGTKLLMEWGSETGSNNYDSAGIYLERRNLEAIFLSLDSQAVQMGVVAYRDRLSLPAIDDELLTPTSFANVEEAHVALNQIFNRLSHWEQWVEPSVVGNEHQPTEEWMKAEKQILQAQLASWDSAFESLRSYPHLQSSSLLLLVQRTVIQINFNKAEGPTEMEWDKSMPLFRDAVEYAEAYMELTVDRYQPYPVRPVFTVAMDIVLSLFLISTRCRNSNLRLRALAMLKTCGRKEGIWDSHLSAKLAEKIIELEESGALEDGTIPESARIWGLDVRLDEETGGEVTSKKHVHQEDGSQGVETIESALVW